MTDARLALRRVLDAARALSRGQFVYPAMVSAAEIADVERLADWLLLHPPTP